MRSPLRPGDLYDAVKIGRTGDGGRFGLQQACMVEGVLLGITISSAITGLGIAKTAIGWPCTAPATDAGRVGLSQWEFNLWKLNRGLGYKAFGANLFLALAAGLGIGMFTGSPYTGALAFTVVMNLKMGETIVDEFANIVDYIKYLLEDMTWTNILTKQYEDSKMSFGEWKHWNKQARAYTTPLLHRALVTIRPVGPGQQESGSG